MSATQAPPAESDAAHVAVKPKRPGSRSRSKVLWVTAAEYRLIQDNRRASAEKRLATIAATRKTVGAERPKADPDDVDANRSIDAQRAGWDRAIEQATAVIAEDESAAHAADVPADGGEGDADPQADAADAEPDIAVAIVVPARPTRKASGAKRSAAERVADPPPATGIALIERVTRAVERELTQIEIIVGGHHVEGKQRSEAERRARTLASLARTLAEVRRMRAQDDLKRPDDDGAEPRDIDAFRLELAQRLGRLVAEAKALHPEPPESA